MTRTRTKIRSLLLAVLVVCSAFTGVLALSGSVAADEVADGDVVFAGETVTFDTSGTSASAGDTLRLVQNPGTDDATTVRQVSVNSSGIAEINTDDLETDDYGLFNDGEELVTFDLIVQSLDTEFDEDSVDDDESATLEVSSNRVEDFTVTVEADGLSNDDLLDIFAASGATENEDDEVEFTTSDGEEVEANFDGIDADDYTFNFSVADTTAESSADITVTEAEGAEMSLAENSYTVESGDATTLTVEFTETTEGYIQIGDDDIGYKNTWLVEDTDEDGTVNLTFNSFATGTSPYGLSVAGDDDAEVTWNSSGSLSAGSTSPPLDPGNYEVEVAANGEDIDDAPDGVGTLAVTERSSSDAATWVTYGEVVNDIEDGDDVVEAIEAGDVTQRSDVALGDYAVVQFQASGISGYLEQNEDDYAGAFGATDDAGASEPLSLSVEQDNPAPNTEGESIPLDELTYVVDDERNSLYVVVPTTGVSGADIEDGDRYNATLEVNADSVLNEDSTDERLSTTFDVTEREVSLDANADDVVEVGASENASVSGSTTVAPGTEVTVRLRSVSGAENPFVMSETVTVAEDGSIDANFDLADVAVGTNLTVAVSASPSLDGETEWDGVVVEQTEETPTPTPTDDGTPTDGTPTDDGTPTPTPTATPTPTDDGSPTPTDETTTTTPGFGAVVALVALIGAALLALRRD
jgi:PGF-CTERM protein